jgi:hypothetical protein
MRAVDDDQGPQKPEGKKKAQDGEELESNGNGRSVSEQAQEKQPEVPPPPPLKGDKQLTIGGLGRRGAPIESHVSIMSASVPAEGLFDPEVEGMVVVAYEPFDYDYKPKRKNGKVTGWKLIQSLRPTHVVKVPAELEDRVRAVLAEHELEPTPA